MNPVSGERVPASAGSTEIVDGQAAPREIIRRFRPGQRIIEAFLVFAGVWIVWTLATNSFFKWNVVWRYLFDDLILRGLQLTLLLTAVCMVLGCVIGLVLAMMQLSRSRIIRGAASGYVWFFRATPVLVQLIFWFNLAALFPSIGIGIPFGGPKWVEVNANILVTPFFAAVIGLGLHEGAYMTEIIRGGLRSVDQGQSDAATSLGFGRIRMLWRIILPQAMSSIIPTTGNQVISMLKYTSLASVVALQELLSSAQTIYSRTFEIIPLLLVAAIWYLILTSILSVIQQRIERYYARGDVR
mgnify:CR=1 FL=1